jgi:hypothetical protein
MVGGGVCGKAVGIAHIIMTEVGVIMTVFQDSISMYTQVGEGTIETIIGTDIDGITNGFLTADFKRTGRPGKKIAIGKDEELGTLRNIEIDHKKNKDRN